MIIHRSTSGQRGNGQEIRNRFLVVCMCLLLGVSVTGCGAGNQPDEEVVVFAATSVQPALEEVAKEFQAKHGVAVRLNFGPSGALARQIVAGGQADVFISADENWIDRVSSEGSVDEDAKTRLMSNGLVVVAHPEAELELDSIEQLSDLPFRYLLVGDPDFVPAGKYGKQWLESVTDPEVKLSLWESLGDRIAPTSDLRRVLALVESDRSLIGVVYATDLVASPNVKVLHQVPPSATDVNYYSVRLGSSDQAPQRSENTSMFLDHLLSDASSRVFNQFGFRVPTE